MKKKEEGMGGKGGRRKILVDVDLGVENDRIW